MIASDLVYYQKLELRDKICNIKIDDVSETDNYRLQGYILKQCGFTAHEAHYPDDTWVGTNRLIGWRNGK